MENPGATSEAGPVWIESDLDFIDALREQAGGTFKKCFQCGTCSATCALSPETDPFPRKEMIWAVWGLKDRLLRDPDVWLCHQCNDCSTMCPRGGRPGDVLAAVRREAIMHYAFPRFLARWANRPRFIPLLLAIPASILCIALLARDALASLFGISHLAGERIAYAYSSELPQWLINMVFGTVGLLAILLMTVGVVRFWRAIKTTVPPPRLRAPARGWIGSVLATVKRVVKHDDFEQCTAARSRLLPHLLVVFGFMGLTLVTIMVISARPNPLHRSAFVYPFAFLSPWKILANLGGLAVATGCAMMIWDRLRDRDRAGGSTYFDWALIAVVLLVALSGLLTELLHYARYEPHRHVAYFIHLVFVMALFLYLPYSKLAHMVYRGVALVFAERTGRREPYAPAGEVSGGDR